MKRTAVIALIAFVSGCCHPQTIPVKRGDIISQGGIARVAHNSTLTGNGTLASLLGLAKVLNFVDDPIDAPSGTSVNDYDPWHGGPHTARVEVDLNNITGGQLTITGIVAGNDGDFLYLWDGGGSPANNPDWIVLTNNDVSSAPNNRVWLASGKPAHIPNNDGILLVYIAGFGWTSFSVSNASMVRAQEFSLELACVPSALATGSTYTDYNPFAGCAAGFSSYVRQDATGGGTATISGLIFSGPPNQDGREILFQNISAATSIAITNDVGTAGNHILTPTGGTITLAPKQSMTLHYDRDAVVYRVDAFTGGATISGLTTNHVVKAGSSTSIVNAWPIDDGTDWGVSGKLQIHEATGDLTTAGYVATTGGVKADTIRNLSNGGALDISNTSVGGTVSFQSGFVVTNGGAHSINGFLYDNGGETGPTTSATNGFATSSNNTTGRVRPGVQTSVTVTLAAPAPNGTFCTVSVRGAGVIAIGVDCDDSASTTTGVITFNCYATTTGVAANCPDIVYRIERF